jgi:hypothetical protein
MRTPVWCQGRNRTTDTAVFSPCYQFANPFPEILAIEGFQMVRNASGRGSLLSWSGTFHEFSRAIVHELHLSFGANESACSTLSRGGTEPLRPVLLFREVWAGFEGHRRRAAWRQAHAGNVSLNGVNGPGAERKSSVHP